MKVEIDWSSGEIDSLKRALSLWNYFETSQKEKDLGQLLDEVIEDFEIKLKLKVLEADEGKRIYWARIYSSNKYALLCQCDFILDKESMGEVFCFSQVLKYKAVVGLDPYRAEQMIKLIVENKNSKEAE
jgi:hypothetical protein